MALPDPDPQSTCLVTGASSGIGAEVARGLARRGHGVTLAARREERLRELAEEISGEHDVRVETIAIDVTDKDARSRLKADIEERGLAVEVLVNNAGFGSGGAFVEQDAEEEASIIATNVEALVAITGHFLPAMVERGRGAVLNLASLISFQPVPFQATYGASKSAVLAFTEAIHEELRGSGVTITAICPGPVRTEFGEQGGFGGADDKIPDFVWLEADKVAEDAIEGLEKGERVVVPGALNQLAAFAGHYMPRSMLLPVARRVWPVE
jgi:short-subunit dehydrogenase